ncbi:hypothetical protein PInf_014812 [Phytophthora infestans]|nr:hypothetical protein PInf_014812 [Phytophthora infestans]
MATLTRMCCYDDYARSSAGKTLPNIVNDLLTERALGRVIDEGSDDSKWLWNGEKVLDLPSFDAPREDGLVSYGAFLRAKFSLSGDPKIAKENKHTRKVLRQDFTATGNPGEGLKSEHEELLQHLLLPRTEASETQLKELGLDESPHCFIVPAFFRFLEHLQQNEATLALRDFYPHWFRNKEDASAGKLLVVDPTDLADGVHAMFFDDNILPHDAHIVDARFAHNDSALSSEETRELHLMRVEPLDVIQRETLEDVIQAVLQPTLPPKTTTTSESGPE